MNKLFVYFLLLLPFAVSAATLDITTTCQTPTQTITTNNGCHTPNITSTATVNLNFATDPAQFSTFTAHQYTYASPILMGIDDIPTNAISLAIFHDDLITAGPSRPGYYVFFRDGIAVHNLGYTNIQIQLTALDRTISFDGGPVSPLLPIQLGTGLTIDYRGYLLAGGDFQEGPGIVDANFTYQFRFYEADGVTPVAVTETPEPSTGTLLVISGCATLVWIRFSVKNE